MADNDTLEEISQLLLQILNKVKDSNYSHTDITTEKLLTVEQVCELTGFSERFHSF